MDAACAAVSLIIAVGHFAVEYANPKVFTFVGLCLSFATLYDFNREVLNPASSYCVTERRGCFGVLEKRLFNQLTRLSDIRVTVKRVRARLHYCPKKN